MGIKMLEVAKVKTAKGFKSHSLDDILAAIKKSGQSVNFSEELVMMGHQSKNYAASAGKSAMVAEWDRVFIKCTATAGTGETGTSVIEISGSDGMTPTQASGATATYARKYAATGLFGISTGDKDVDFEESKK